MPRGAARTLTRRAAVIATLAGVGAAVSAAPRSAGVPGSRGWEPGARSSDAAAPAAPATTAPAGVGSAAVRPVELTPRLPVRPELPRGGRVLFPDYRLVGFSGGPGSAAFGRLGVGDLDARVREIEQWGARYAAGRRPMPVLELIAVVAQPRPGPDGRYRVRADPAVLRTYLDAARRHRALLLLNIQPGRATFLDEVVALQAWLREPDVGLALDPEWAVHAGQVPGRIFGRTTGAEIDAVARYVSRLVTTLDLPEKALVVHQLAPDVVRGLSALVPHPGVSVIKSVDGIGPAAAKVSTWRTLVADLPPGVRAGFKLFFEEDAAGGGRIMTPAEVMALIPTPDYVLYE